MATRFNTTFTLPDSSSKDDFGTLCKTMDPVTALVDDKTLEIVSNQIVASGIVNRFEPLSKSYTDIAVAAASTDISLFTLPAGGLIGRVVVKQSASFDDGAGPITAVTASIGITGDLTKYTAAFDVYQAPGDTVFQLTVVNKMETFASGGTDVRLAFTATGGNLDTLTAGALDVYFEYAVVNG